MFVSVIPKVIALALGLAPVKPPAPPLQLASPEQMHQKITTVLLECNRRELASTVKLREALERDDPKLYAEMIAKLKGWEESYRKRIEKLEGGSLAPPVPVMPLERPRPQPPVPKPPVRD